MRRVPPTFLALVALGAAALLTQVLRQIDARSPGRAAASPDPLGDIGLRLEGTTAMSRVSGAPEWSVRASRIEFRQAPGAALEYYRAAEFAGIRSGVLYRAGKPEGSFAADHALLDRQSGRFDVTGGIRLVTPAGDVIRSETLVWSPGDDYARFPGGVTGKVRGYDLHAPQVLFAMRRRLLQCPQGADIARGRETLRAESLVWDIDRGFVHCAGSVYGTRGDLTYAGRDASLDQKARTLRIGRATVTIAGEGTGAEPASRR